MSGVLRRPLWTIHFIHALTLAALAGAFSFSIGQAAQSREDRADSQQPNSSILSARTKCNSNSNVIDNLDITHLTIAAALPAALGDGDCFHIVGRIEHFIAAVFRKQIEFHTSPRTSKRHKTVLEALPLEWGGNRPTRQSAPSAMLNSSNGFSQAWLSHRARRSRANGSRKTLSIGTTGGRRFRESTTSKAHGKGTWRVDHNGRQGGGS